MYYPSQEQVPLKKRGHVQLDEMSETRPMKKMPPIPPMQPQYVFNPPVFNSENLLPRPPLEELESDSHRNRFDVEEDDLTFFTKCKNYGKRTLASCNEAMMTCKTSVESAIRILAEIKSYIAGVGDQIIAESRIKRQLEKKSQSIAKIEEFEQFLAKQKSETSEVILEDVLKMVSLELLLEDILNELLVPEEDLPSLLIKTVEGAISNHETDFSWKFDINDSMFDSAYKEFINKQRIKNLLRVHFPNNTKQTTFNMIIDKLFELYNRNFNQQDRTIHTHKLTIEGRVKGLKSIGRTQEKNLLYGSKKTHVLSAVKYDSLWRKYTKSKKIVDDSFVELRQQVAASENKMPIATGNRLGINNNYGTGGPDAYVTTNIPPLANVVTKYDSPMEEGGPGSPVAEVYANYNSPSDDEIDSSGKAMIPYSSQSDEEEEVTGRKHRVPILEKDGKRTREQMKVAAHMKAAELMELQCSQLIPNNIMKEISKQQTEKMKEHNYDIDGEIADLAIAETKLVNDALQEVKVLSAQLKSNQESDPEIFNDAYLTDIWIKSLKRIFSNLYEETQKIKDKRANILSKLKARKTSTQKKPSTQIVARKETPILGTEFVGNVFTGLFSRQSSPPTGRRILRATRRSPPRRPGVTPGGKKSLKKHTKSHTRKHHKKHLHHTKKR